MNQATEPIHADGFSGRVFSTPAERLHQITHPVLRHVGNANRALKILDLGCGTGQQAFDLVRTLPNAHVTGIDISVANIEQAERACKRSGFAARMAFIAADYFECTPRAFDVIVSYSTLQLIPRNTEQLFERIAGDLCRGGLLVAAMPRKCASNTLLTAIRRVFRQLRGPVTDAIVLKAGTLLHRGKVPEDILRERIHYMYVLPYRYSERRLDAWLDQKCGLELIEQYDLPWASLAQLQHNMSVFRRRT